jgi:hypothetical protein
MKRSMFIAAIAAFSLLAPVAPANAGTGATCALEVGVKLSPGISAKPSKGTFESTKGTLGCVGFVKNTPVAGQGTISFAGIYGKGQLAKAQGGDTCEAGSGAGTLSASIPKATGGKLTMKGIFKFERVGSNVLVNGKLGGATIVGSFQFAPKLGQDCVQKKVTSATVFGTSLEISPE